uniref:Zinc/iron permease n=1 Tax=Macrostomum lignano TaxID=282301 RepID=A0A1I8G7M1_9PLAT
MLEANQTMTSQFQSVLTDLRIGAKFNASRACARAPAAPAYKEANDSIADSCLSGAQIAESFRLNLTTGLNRDQFGSLAVAMLAVGSLVGEALLHLLPTVVQNGLHGGHGEHGEEEHHEEGGGVPENFVKLVAAAGTLCILHAIDTASVVAGVDNHGHDSEVPTEGQAYSVSTADAEAVEQVPSSATAARSEKPTTFGFIQQSQVSLRELFRKPKRCLSSPIRLCLFVMVSDALHNFADGVAIGAGFAIGDADGLRLSLSIGLHELAHELADFAVLLSCGFSVRGALAINLACTVTAYVGLYVAVPLADASTEAQVWILAVASGMFLYIALVTMTNLVRRSYRPKSKTAFFVGNLGLLCGFLSVIAISMYEFYG